MNQDAPNSSEHSSQPSTISAQPPSQPEQQTIIREDSVLLSYEKEERAKLEVQFKGGSQWFYWIAALSLLNSLIAAFGGQWRFFFGLGITQIVDAVVRELQLGGAGQMLALAFDVLVAGLFALFGYLSGMKMRWAFFVGMGFYVLDAALLLLLGDYLPAAVHGYVLYRMWAAVGAAKKLGELEQRA